MQEMGTDRSNSNSNYKITLAGGDSSDLSDITPRVFSLVIEVLNPYSSPWKRSESLESRQKLNLQGWLKFSISVFVCVDEKTRVSTRTICACIVVLFDFKMCLQCILLAMNPKIIKSVSTVCLECKNSTVLYLDGGDESPRCYCRFHCVEMDISQPSNNVT